MVTNFLSLQALLDEGIEPGLSTTRPTLY